MHAQIFTVSSILFSAALVSASPLQRRGFWYRPSNSAVASSKDTAASGSGGNVVVKDLGGRDTSNPHGLALDDLHVLQLALNLELTELNFFAQGYANFSEEFKAPPYSPEYASLIALGIEQERDHYDLLNSVLYGTGPKNCTYTFGITSAAQFNTVAQVITSVGQAAYLGTGGAFVNKAYLAAASAILGVESRQNSLFRAADNLAFYNGNSFDTALTASQALSQAAGFISNCPASNFQIASKDGPFSIFPTIGAAAASGSTPIKPGARIEITYDPAMVKVEGAQVFFVSQVSSYPCAINVESPGKAWTNLPNQVTTGTTFLIISDAKGTPFPVPDANTRAVGALVVA